MPYPEVDPQPSFPDIERAVLDRWAADGTFRASVEQRPAGPDGSNEFVFYDGPPFANGLPHYGHLLTGYVKDAVPRYQTMRGRRVERRFGWDCHGLPAEVEAERQLGITGKPEIEAMGVAAFNDVCRASVLRYTAEWRAYVTRQARWVDFDDGYKTLDLPYMESVMWAFKTLWGKGLLYEGFRVLAYCWRCETPLSNTETRMDDVYRNRQDPAATVSFEILDDERARAAGVAGARLLAWTTTPWTLPSNLALAVHPDVDYAVVDVDGQRFVLAEARRGAYERELGDGEPVAHVRGADLVGLRYRPLFEYFADRGDAFRVLGAGFVTTEDGTGVVHLAPAFGEDDQIACQEAGIELVMTVDERGRFLANVPDRQGEHVFDANRGILDDLRAAGKLLRSETYDHSYPHCWRCANPLIYKAVSSWFVEVTALRDRMVELNRKITWVPEHIRDGQFGKWLAGARDWSISRNRFWGSPIPVWRSDDPAHPRVDVYGSLDELERDFGVRLDDLHRPAVDELTRPNPDDPTGRSTMRRVPEVLDCWFESGSMPFAQVHFPFENRHWFEHHFPGDFIVEYTPQTRGWFYTLHVLATALFDRPAFKSVICHGTVLGEDGQKMSKSLRNYPDVTEVFDRYGSDAMRWYLLSSPILRGGDYAVTETGIRDALRQTVLPLWNTWYFLTLYAGAARGGAGIQGRFRTDQHGELDRYLLAKLHDLVAGTTAAFDSYDLVAASAEIRGFLDVLTNWYVRRSRDRFWAEDADAFDTLHTALDVLCRVAAPLLPLVTDEVWTGLTGERSVHLADWPDVDALPADPELVAAMDLVREVCSAARGVREEAGRRVRLPLRRLTVAVPGAAAIEPFTGLVREEVNVRHVELSDDVAAHGELRLQLVPRVLGPRTGPRVQDLIKAVKAGDWTSEGGAVQVLDRTLADDEYSLRLVAREGAAAAALPGGRGLVVLDTEVTPELEAEGLARDAIRLVNQARRDADLQVSDRVRVRLGASGAAAAALEEHRDFVARETLATELVVAEPDGAPAGTLGDGSPLTVSFLTNGDAPEGAVEGSGR
ncbi:MAG: isoleucine--tRNA ligase [Actinobacteria bacterium]|nr:isoleucine--tRNA ligase [Actinomycetota bacterium]